ncbi:MAG: hypothetical protein ACO1O6_10170, partial [Bacteroidota bacterium]
MSNVKIRFIDLDEDVNGFGVPEEYLTNFSSPPQSVTGILGVPEFYLISGEISPDDGLSSANNNASGWVNWSGEMQQLTFDYIRPGTQYGLIIDSIYFECPLPCQLAVDLGNDTLLCQNESLVLTAPAALSYLWSDNSTGNQLTVSGPGTYWLEVSDAQCSDRDSIVVTYQNLPSVNLGNDTTLCDDQLISWSFNNPGVSYLWQNNSAANSLTAQTSGLYWLEVDNGACSFRDSVQVTYLSAPQIDLGTDR